MAYLLRVGAACPAPLPEDPPGRGSPAAAASEARANAFRAMAAPVPAAPSGAATPKATAGPRPPRLQTRAAAEAGPRTIEETMRWASSFVARAARHLGHCAVSNAFRHCHWHMTSTFSGAGFAELAAESLQMAMRAFLAERGIPCGRPGPAIVPRRVCDNAPSCLALLRARAGNAVCIFKEVEAWLAQPATAALGDTKVGSIAFNVTVPCERHGRSCPLAPELPRGALHIEVAGPPCPPWSRFGRRRRTDDPRFRVHQCWLALQLQVAPAIIVFENVDIYDLWILRENFANASWELRACILDPRNFGVPMGRPRLYAIIVNKGRAAWKSAAPLHVMLQQLTAVPTMPISAFFQPLDPASSRPLTAGEKRRREDYESLPATHRLARSPLWDLHQAPHRRGRGLLADGALPTFTCGSEALYLRSAGLVLSPLQLLRAMGFPTEPALANAASVPFVDIGALHLSARDLVRMAGNGMSAQCIGACLLIAALHIERC